MHPADLIQFVGPRKERVQASDFEENAARPPLIHLRAIVAVRQETLRGPVPSRRDILCVGLTIKKQKRRYKGIDLLSKNQKAAKEREWCAIVRRVCVCVCTSCVGASWTNKKKNWLCVSCMYVVYTGQIECGFYDKYTLYQVGYQRAGWKPECDKASSRFILPPALTWSCGFADDARKRKIVLGLDGRTNLFGVDPSTRPEVRELEPPAQVVGALDQNVFRLYVSMENSLPVHMIQRLQELVHVASHQLFNNKFNGFAHKHLYYVPALKHKEVVKDESTDDVKGGICLRHSFVGMYPIKRSPPHYPFFFYILFVCS